MERRKRTSMYDSYREDIVAALEAGKTIRQIYDEIICPALNGGCEYSGLVYYVNKNGLRYVTENDGYEPVISAQSVSIAVRSSGSGLIPCGFARKRSGRFWRWLKRRHGGARYDREGER